MTQFGTIVVTRRRDPSYAARAFKVKIDGVVAAKVRNGKTAEFQVSPGPHQVQVAVDWNRSPAVSVEVAADAHTRLATGVGDPVKAFVNPRNYLDLRLVGG